MGQTLPLFCLFSFFLQYKDKYTTYLTINDKSIDGVLGSRTWGSRMEGRDESTALWWHQPGLVVTHKWEETEDQEVRFLALDTNWKFFTFIRRKILLFSRTVNYWQRRKRLLVKMFICCGYSYKRSMHVNASHCSD